MAFETNFIQNQAPLAFVQGLNLPGIQEGLRKQYLQDREFILKMKAAQAANSTPLARLKAQADATRYQNTIDDARQQGLDDIDATKNIDLLRFRIIIKM